MAPGLPCFLPQYLKLSALQYLSQHQLVVLKKKKKIWRSSRARSEAPAWRIKYVTKSPVRNFFPFISQRRRSVPVYNNKRDTNSIIFFDNRKWRVCHTLYYVSFIRHLHISHSAPYLSTPAKFHITVFHFPWVLQPSQENSKTMLMQNFVGANMVYYGGCASGVQCRIAHIRGPKTLTFKTAGLRVKSLLWKWVLFTWK